MGSAASNLGHHLFGEVLVLLGHPLADDHRMSCRLDQVAAQEAGPEISKRAALDLGVSEQCEMVGGDHLGFERAQPVISDLDGSENVLRIYHFAEAAKQAIKQTDVNMPPDIALLDARLNGNDQAG